MSRLRRVIFIVLCFELGALLVVLPWTAFWEHNFFLNRYPEIRQFLLNFYLRGAITGIGLLDIWIAIGWILPRRTKKAVA